MGYDEISGLITTGDEPVGVAIGAVFLAEQDVYIYSGENLGRVYGASQVGGIVGAIYDGSVSYCLNNAYVTKLFSLLILPIYTSIA